MSPIVVGAVLVAGAAGAVLRWLCQRWLVDPRGGFPWAVMVVNVVGSAVAGFAAALTTGDLRLVIVTGFCGGLTTFSTLAVDTVMIATVRRQLRIALLSVAANLALGIGACALGYAVAAAVFSAK